MRCKVVPIMHGSRVYEKEDPYAVENDDEEEYDERPYHLFQSKFQPFARGRMVTEHDEKDTWGHTLPEDEVTWLKRNDGAWAETEKLREVQTAHPTVSS